MKKVLYALLLCLLILIPINANAVVEKTKGELTTKLYVENSVLRVDKEISICGEYETDKLTENILINNEDEEIEINSVIIEDESGKSEIQPYEKESEGYKLSKGRDKYTLTLQFPKKIKVKKVYIEYSFKSITDYDENFNYDYIHRKIPDKFMDVSLESQKVEIGESIVGCWIKGEYSNFYEDSEEKEIIIDSMKSNDIILSFEDGYDFFKDKKSSGTLVGDGIYSLTEKGEYIKLFNNETHSRIAEVFYSFVGIIIALAVFGIIFRPCWKLLWILFLPSLYIIKFIKRQLIKGNNDKNIERHSQSETIEYTENIIYEKDKSKEYEEKVNKTFLMPKYINPAYLGILFNTVEEDVVFTILCELIRKGAVEVKDDENYIDKKKSGIYRKYILALTENCVNLEAFEKEFIDKLRDMDDINLINLEDIQKLVGKGYFKGVISSVEESFNNYLRTGLSEDSSLEEVLKSRNIELNKWEVIREQMKVLKVKDIRKLTIKEMEYLHVFSTGIALRDKYFSVFKVFSPAELRISKYFEQIQKEFDNGKTVISYLEKTFLK